MSFFPTEALRIFEAAFGETAGDKAFMQFLSHSAGPTASDYTDMRVAASATGSSTFEYICPVAKEANIQRLNFVMLDSAITGEKFGGIAQLTNGCKIELIASGSEDIVLDFMDGKTIRSNTHFGYLAGVDIDVGTSSDQVVVRWTLSKSFGGPLRMKEGQRIRVTLQDDLSTLDEFSTMVQGKIRDISTAGF